MSHCDNRLTPPRHAEHEVVRFLTASGRWPIGTTGTVVEADDTTALIEIVDDRGHALGFVSLPHESLAHATDVPARAAS